MTMTTIKAMMFGAGAALVGLLLFFVGRWTAPAQVITEEVVNTVTRVVRDTVTIKKPVTCYVHTRDSILVPIRDTLHVRDTLYISVPREVKVYEDSRYRAEVSGYQPSLDRIDIYQQTQYIERDVVRTVEGKKRTRWGIGVQLGYGVNIGSEARVFPYVGVGLQYSLICW